MVSQTKEQALEAAIKVALTGICQEVIKNQIALHNASYKPISHNGFMAGFSTDFDKNDALDTILFWQFLNSTQSHELESFKQYNPNDWERKILDRYDRNAYIERFNRTTHHE